MLPLLPIALALIVGILVGDAIQLPLLTWTAITGSLLATAFLFKRKGNLQHIAIVLTTICLGAALITHTHSLLRPALPINKPVPYHAIITSKPIIHGRVTTCDMAIYEAEGHTLSRPMLVKASFLRDTLHHHWRMLRTGLSIEAFSSMELPANWHTTQRFNYVRWIHVHGFTARTFILPRSWQTCSNKGIALPRLLNLKLKASALRDHFLDMPNIIQVNDQRYAVIAAMTLGDRSYLSQQTREQFNLSGGAHVLALSGLHLSIIYAILTLLLPLGRRTKWLSQSLILTTIWTYALIVGMGASVIRAATMLSILSVGIVLNRGKTSLNTLSLAAIIMLIADPMSLWDVGFQLSFMAVLGILLFYPFLFRLVPTQQKAVRVLWGMIAVSLAAQTGTAPLVMYYFGRFASYFLLTNMVVVPAATLIVYGTALLLLTSPLPVLGKTIATALFGIAGFMNRALSLIASLPYASIEGINLSVLQVISIYILIAATAVFIFYYNHVKSVKKLDSFNQTTHTV